MPKIAYQTKRFRGNSLLRIEQANEIIEEYQAQGFCLNLRQLYYQFVSRDLIPNTNKSYDNLGAIISDARLAGLIDWEAIEDLTRRLRKNSHWSSPDQIVQACSEQYRIDRWKSQRVRPEVWIEKDALVGIIDGVCEEWDVPFFSCRGYTSQSAMWEAGQRLRTYIRRGQQPVIFHFGDHDPSGLDMTRDIADRLSMFVGRPVNVKRIALNWDQVEEYQPPPNPAKTTDSRFEEYRREHGEESWELDALEPSVIVDLVRQSVTEIMDTDNWNEAVHVERQQREELATVSSAWDDVVTYLNESND